jgi:hypothetical protein
MLRGALANTKKLKMTTTQFIAKMKGFVSELVVDGKRVDDDNDELMGYTLTGLDGEYTLFVASINNVPTTTLTDMCSKLQAYDYRQSTLSKTEQTTTVLQSSTNVDARDGEGEYYRDDREPPRHDGGGYRDGGRYRQDGRGGEQYRRDDYQWRDGGHYHRDAGGRPRDHDDGGRYRHDDHGAPKGVVVVEELIFTLLTRPAKSARSMVTLAVSAGCAMLIVMMMAMTHTMREAHMGSTLTVTWTLGLPITLLEN